MFNNNVISSVKTISNITFCDNIKYDHSVTNALDKINVDSSTSIVEPFESICKWISVNKNEDVKFYYDETYGMILFDDGTQMFGLCKDKQIIGDTVIIKNPDTEYYIILVNKKGTPNFSIIIKDIYTFKNGNKASISIQEAVPLINMTFTLDIEFELLCDTFAYIVSSENRHNQIYSGFDSGETVFTVDEFITEYTQYVSTGGDTNGHISVFDNTGKLLNVYILSDYTPLKANLEIYGYIINYDLQQQIVSIGTMHKTIQTWSFNDFKPNKVKNNRNSPMINSIKQWDELY